MLRATPDVLTDLKELIHSPGYIYSLCLILYEDFHQDLNKVHEVNYRAKLSVKECSLIIGFLVQQELDLSYPASPEVTFERKEKTYSLMRELQASFTAPQMEKIQELIKRKQAGEDPVDEWQDQLDFFVKDRGMVEPMFYAGDGVYDFQYLEYLEAKYKYDRDWLLEHKHFDLVMSQVIVKAIKEIDAKKGREILPVNIKEVFPEVAAKARKKLKKSNTKEEIDVIEHQQLITASFYRYRALFPEPDLAADDITSGWRTFYEHLLDLTVIRKADLPQINAQALDHFLANFSFQPACNESYEGPGHYNILNSRPLIQLDEERYWLPIGYLLPEAVYESPFYWMWDDKKYRSSLAQHRGDVGEEIAYGLLSQVFGQANTHRSVMVETKKGQRETDIDVLCLLGNKALCVQVKSKKLTLNARRGDFEQLSTDFKGAVQDAYDQGLVSREALFKRSAKFICEGKELDLPEEINEVYILGLTTENYPALTHQVNYMLQKQPQDPFPLFVSAFDLELLVHYLKDPYDFLYYVRQRTALMESFRADEELIYLGYHLDQKLWPREGYDYVSIDTDFGGLIDRNYYPYKTGMTELLPEKDDPIHNRWKDPQFDAFTQAIKNSGHSKATDIVFHLLDWSGEARTDVVANLHRLQQISRNEGKLKSAALPSAAGFGLSYVVIHQTDPAELQFRANTYARLRKYLNKSRTWLGIGAFANSPNLIDLIVYLDEAWQPDPELENTYAEELAKMRTTAYTPMKGKLKIGRNDPCPCKSGKKFKKCCGS